MERYDLSRSKIRNLANDNILAHYRPSPRKILFPQDEVIEYEERHTRKGKKKEQPKRKALSVRQKRIWRID
jgi:hypothetical protein